MRRSATGLDAIDAGGLEGQDRITYSMLARLVADQTASINAALGEVGLSNTITGPVSSMLSSLPRVSLDSEQRSRDYLVRLGSLGDYFDAALERYRQAGAEGRHQTRHGVLAVIEQIDDYLATELETDVLAGPTPTDVDVERGRPRPPSWCPSGSGRRCGGGAAALESEFLPVARGDEQVGVCNVPGGLEGYAAASRQFTTTDLTSRGDPPDRARRGRAAARPSSPRSVARALWGPPMVAEVVDRLRGDLVAAVRSSADEILADVTEALRRAEAALPPAFLDYDIAPCSTCRSSPRPPPRARPSPTTPSRPRTAPGRARTG